MPMELYEHVCKYGHYDCSYVERGPCCDEELGRREAEQGDPEAGTCADEGQGCGPRCRHF